MTRRESTRTTIHERHARELTRVPQWMPAAARTVADHLRAFAARYPDRFEYRGGKLQQKDRRHS